MFHRNILWVENNQYFYLRSIGTFCATLKAEVTILPDAVKTSASHTGFNKNPIHKVQFL